MSTNYKLYMISPRYPEKTPTFKDRIIQSDSSAKAIYIYGIMFDCFNYTSFEDWKTDNNIVVSDSNHDIFNDISITMIPWDDPVHS